MLQQQADVSPELVRATVKAILASPAFRSSRQCCMLLSYIVEHSLAHEDDLLRERVIGARVFGRSPDYDTGNDPVVRSRAAEVRKRLAQFYIEHRDATEVHVAVPSGSYRAVFSADSIPTELVSHEPSIPIAEERARDVEILEAPIWPSELEPARGAPKAGKGTWRVVWACVAFVLLACLAVAVLLRARHQHRDDALFREFWEAETPHGKPTIVYIGANYAYRLSPEYLDAYRAAHHLKNEGPEFFIDLKPTDNLPARDLLPTNNLIGFGDVAATSRIVAALALLGKPYDLRYGEDLSVSDLHAAPVILIGGFSNPWTMKLTAGLRYTLDHGDRVIDTQASNAYWTVDLQSDYAVVSRLPHSQTGGLVVAVAGVGTSANQAAADFISNPQRIASVLENAPQGWEGKKLQILLHASTIDDVPVSVEVKEISFN